MVKDKGFNWIHLGDALEPGDLGAGNRCTLDATCLKEHYMVNK